MLMTMEMWWLGFSMDRFRLALFILLDVPLLIGLAFYEDIGPSPHRLADVLDAFTAYAVGFAAAAVLLAVFAVIGPGMSADEIVGKIAIQSVPASIGALLARSQLGEGEHHEHRKHRTGYAGGLFLMAVGALFLTSTLAATEEMVLISYMMSPGHVVALMAFSLAVIHGFIHAVATQGEADLPSEAMTFRTVFLHFSVVGYGLALLISLFILWVFGRTDGLAASQILQATVVLGFPAALGAGAARLIL